MFKRLLVLCGLALAGCSSAKDAVPLSNYPNFAGPPVMRLHVDGNGTFYPDEWRRTIGEKAVLSQHSLLLAANCRRRTQAGINRPLCTPGMATDLDAFQARVWKDIAAFLESKERLFVIVHGFNNEQAGAATSYSVVRDNIRFDPAKDALIELYWDGDKGTGLGGAVIWRFATATSQVAGVRVLRPILNTVSNKDVFLISHSRGASVVLSAIGEQGPAWSPAFAKATQGIMQELGKPDILKVDPLLDRGNRIKVLLMAPAVGNPDFWREGSTASTYGDDPGNCDFRTFSPQVKSIAYTVNPLDPVLAKYFIPGMAARYNATDLGLRQWVGDYLRLRHFPQMRPYKVKFLSHDFQRYAAHPTFRRMLHDADVQLRGSVPPKPDPLVNEVEAWEAGHRQRAAPLCSGLRKDPTPAEGG